MAARPSCLECVEESCSNSGVVSSLDWTQIYPAQKPRLGTVYECRNTYKISLQFTGKISGNPSDPPAHESGVIDGESLDNSNL
jgi:hypothetical protein